MKQALQLVGAKRRRNAQQPPRPAQPVLPQQQTQPPQTPQQQQPQRRKFTSASRIFVYGLRADMTKQALTSIFAKYGEVQDIYRPESKNFAFVRMDYPENSLRAIEELQGRPMLSGGYPMRLRVAVSNTGVWVGDLPDGVDNEALGRAFGRFGEYNPNSHPSA